MKFRTEIKFQSLKKIHSNSRILMIGSCFAEHMHTKFLPYKLPITNNPYGITYNPISIAEQITSLSSGSSPTITLLNKKPYPFEHHGTFRKSTEQETRTTIDCSWTPAQRSISSINHCILTLGSAYAWMRNGSVVNNCHKRPREEFTRSLLSVESITSALKKAIQYLPNQCVITCTISPVRHLRDGIEKNNISKSTLRLALHQLQREDSRVQYFPSYDIMMDDLRDYRFYKDDLTHPNSMALSYIWSLFQHHTIDESLHSRYTRTLALHKRLTHRPQDRSTPDFTRFLDGTHKELELLKKQHPQLDWRTETEQLSNLISPVVP